MHFERSLKRTIYAPWSEQYIDYTKLKNLLRDEGSDAGSTTAKHPDGDADDWTEENEQAFVEELVNVQLEKVHGFQVQTVQSLRERTARCEEKLEGIPSKEDKSEDLLQVEEQGQAGPSGKGANLNQDALEILRQASKELDGITKEMNELEKFSRINYTGFLKATKKHDRKRGHAYRVRPLMQVRLAALPFNKEDYSPLLFRLSTMYAFVRQRLEGKGKAMSFSESQMGMEDFTSHKFWVHPENLLELKTVILRRLPVLVYNPQSSKVAEGGQRDPTMTSIYFDNPSFSLYTSKVSQDANATSLRLRWYDQLSQNPEIYCEKKTMLDDNTSKEQKFTLTKQKYIQPFLSGEYKMDKDVKRASEKYGEDSDQVAHLKRTVDDIKDFVETSKLQPVLRANYTRTAFQMPGDSRVRITLDTDLALIREDSLDEERPFRDPAEWHRTDIDEAEMEYPFKRIRKGEINRFPYAILEIRIRGSKNYEWATELMSSHLVKPAPRFSKFVHGVAQLFDDNVNTFPFWLSEVDTDIRKDPQQAFEEEQQKKAQAAEDQFAVGSLLKTSVGSTSFKPAVQSPVGSPKSLPSIKQHRPSRATADMTRMSLSSRNVKKDPKNFVEEVDSDDDNLGVQIQDSHGFRSLLPSMSRYTAGRSDQIRLPPGVHEPTFWIKNEGPVKVEAKVWLANQRTFIKWQHIGALLASLSLALFNAVGADNNIARSLAVVYTLVAVFSGAWGWIMYMVRSRLIRQRSGRDFDNVFGPILVCIGLMVALILNFVLKYQNIKRQKSDHQDPGRRNTTLSLLDEL